MISGPSTSKTVRAELSSSSQNAVDGFLKALKAYTRQLNALLDLHATEVAVLERLYYKGKNQHGASLHWKRVCEARRFGKCLQDAQLDSLVQDLRTSFYGEEAVSSKRLKGSWTHYPSAPYLSRAVKRADVCLQLLKKVCSSVY
ncbi:hypothetical protein K488DRAFT_53531 [Vararia minispora EC-137]|uniref:Uncharacterized protein n=1 Tax=Vararia minispora EC-137 TaxID=1314806 RepID=A0ACB8QGF5_9AGAM|nr:hypothetical protein K488DRAFT_53531 [Vararia minispora EC-137]